MKVKLRDDSSAAPNLCAIHTYLWLELLIQMGWCDWLQGNDVLNWGSFKLHSLVSFSFFEKILSNKIKDLHMVCENHTDIWTQLKTWILQQGEMQGHGCVYVLTWFSLFSLPAVHDQAIPGSTKYSAQLSERKCVSISAHWKQKQKDCSRQKHDKIMRHKLR